MENSFMLSTQQIDFVQTKQELFASDPIFLNRTSYPEILSLLQSYCVCDLGMSLYCCCKTQSDDASKLVRKVEEQKLSPTSIDATRSSNSSRSTRPAARDRTAYLQERLAALLNELDTITDSAKTIVFGRPKVNCLMQTRSLRRSRFTGVFKNANRWQALIDILGKKTYISSYSSEMEAAYAYDLMSLLVKGLRAPTNFSHSKTCIYELIDTSSDIIDKFCS